MFSFLASPYPPPHLGLARNLLVSLLIGTFVAVFLIVFKPFDTAESTIPNLNLFLLGYGGVVAATIFLPHLLLYLLAPRLFEEANWTLGRQLLYIFCVVSMGISASYGYLLQSGGAANWGDYVYFFRNGLLVAAFPIIVITLLDYIRKLRHYESGAAGVNSLRNKALQTPSPAAPTASAPAAAPTSTAPIELTDDQGRMVIKVDIHHLWCLHSDGNYVEIWARKEEAQYTRTLIRNTLANLKKQLPQAPFITSHRSWVVNPDLVEEVTGNAQGYQLHLTGAPTVLVARGRSKAVLQGLRV